MFIKLSCFNAKQNVYKTDFLSTFIRKNNLFTKQPFFNSYKEKQDVYKTVLFTNLTYSIGKQLVTVKQSFNGKTTCLQNSS